VRAILKTSLAFGRLAIPVGLASTHADGDVGFRTIHRECQTPIQMRVWCPACERVVEDGEELVKGAEVAPGQFVLLEAEELAAVVPEDTRMIELVAFAPADEVDPVEFERAYYLAPSKEALMRRPYALLARVLAEYSMVGLARLVAWETEHIAAVRPIAGGALALHLLRPLEDRVDPGPIEEQLAEVELAQDEIDLATELVMRLLRAPTELGPSRKRERMRGLLEDKLAGREIVRVDREPSPPAEAQLPIVELDLAGALRKSLRETRKPRAPRKRKTPAKA
jgi:DNA end-binding protein Ku